MPKNLFTFMLIVLWAGTPVARVFGQSEAGTTEINKLHSHFEAELEMLNTPVITLNGKYRGYLEKQKEAYQRAGNLEAMLAVDEELKAFESAPTKELSSIRELNRLQSIYRKQRASLSTQQIELKLEVIRKFRKTASDLASAWTRAGKIEDAKLALAESKRFAEMEKDPSLVVKKDPGDTMAKVESGFKGGQVGEEMINSLGMKLRWIPAGKFTMGGPEGQAGEQEEQVRVELTKGFWIGKYEVTQEEYEKIMGTNPSKFKDVGKRAPVEQVNWEEALTFCTKLTDLAHNTGKLPRDWSYSLPTEAQWEYACRAGSEGPYSGGSLDELGWYKENGDGTTHETGKKKANAWELYDMHGNVREWCLDGWSIKINGGQDPAGPKDSPLRVYRGGSWVEDASYCRSGARSRGKPMGGNGFQGFRPVLIQSP